MATILVSVVKDYILIVDDEIPITKLLKRLLVDEGEIHVAYNGEEGISKIIDVDFDLIISDIDMPIKNGLSFYSEAIQKKPHLKGRFLFMTGTLDHGRLEYFNKHGIEYLIKPSTLTDIRIAAKRILLLTKTTKEQG